MTRVHWFQASIPAERRALACSLIAEALGYEPESLPYGRYRYQGTDTWGCAHVWFDTDPEHGQKAHAGRATLCLEGEACDRLGTLLLPLIRELTFACWAKATRVDVFWQDAKRLVSLDEVYRAACAGEFTGFRVWTMYDSRRGKVRSGHTIQFGNRGSTGSGKLLRVYDKGLESEGAIPGIRWEAEFTGDRAQQVTLGSLSAENPERAFGSYLGGCIAFVRKEGGHGHISRCEVLEWWTAIVAEISAEGTRLEREPGSFEAKQRWIAKGVAPSLAMLGEVFGPVQLQKWLAELVARAQGKLSDKDTATAHYWRTLYLEDEGLAT